MSDDPHCLYVIVRADLPPGLLLAQAVHVARKFTRRYAEISVSEDENVVVLAVPSESELDNLLQWLSWETPHVPREEFHEPDLDGSLTAISIVRTPEVKKRLASLPLALSLPAARAA